MIPTVILFGLLLGRWPRITLAAGTLGWPLPLLQTGGTSPAPELLVAAGLGFANTLAGVAAHRLGGHLLRTFWQVRPRRDA